MPTDKAGVVKRATVAIMMSNYNHGRYLGESLGGIRSQTRPADEVILVDDASTDGSPEILERFAAANPNVKFVRNPQRLGVNGAIARAMAEVTADYLVWTAADDRLLPHFLENSMAALERHPQAGLCFSETTQLLGDSRLTKRFAEQPELKRIFDLSDLPEYLAPAQVLERMKRAYLPIAANTVVVKRAALESLQGYHRQLEWHSDSFAYMVIALRHGACVVPETLAVIRTTPGAYSTAMSDPTRQMRVLRNLLAVLATPQYRDIRRAFREAPSNFSPGLRTMLKAQLRNPRDWDLFVAYFLWKLGEYRKVSKRGWVGVAAEFMYRLPLFRRARRLEKQLRDERDSHGVEIALLNEEKVELARQVQALREENAARTGSVPPREEVHPAEYHSATAAIAEMLEEMKAADPIYSPSRFWEHFNKVNLEQLASAGFQNFKLTANQNYHNFTPTSLFDSKVRALLRLWKKSPTLKPLLVSLPRTYMRMEADGTVRTQQEILGFSDKRMFAYQVFLALLWTFSRSIDTFKVLDRMQEPELGNPIRVLYGDRLISQDLATSSREYNSIMQVVSADRSAGRRLVVGELGAGYGRLAHVFSKMTPCRYVVFDIPPALGVAQWYLGSLFPDKKIFRFRRFGAFADVAAELEASDIAFFTPNQMALFPDGYFDAMLSISSLHEMRLDQIRHYLGQLARLARSYIYLKQYYGYVNPIDGIFVERGTYALPPGWQVVFDRPDVYGDFFELMQRRAA